MKLSRASSYAIHALVHIAAAGAGRPLASHHTAEALGFPESFLAKALVPLVRAQILRAARGQGGGYRLARSATTVTMLEVVEAVDGPIRGQSPFVGGPADGLAERLQAICDHAAGRTREALGEVRISDLAGTEG